MINFILSLRGIDDGDLLLVGDFNSPDVNWCSLTASSLRSSVLCDTFFAKNLVQLVDEKTHALGNILDLISTDCVDRISNICINPFQLYLPTISSNPFVVYCRDQALFKQNSLTKKAHLNGGKRQRLSNLCLLAMTEPSFRKTWTLSMPGVLSGKSD